MATAKEGGEYQYLTIEEAQVGRRNTRVFKFEEKTDKSGVTHPQCLIYCDNKHGRINQQTLIVAIHFGNWVTLEHDAKVNKFRILGNAPIEIEKYDFIKGKPPVEDDESIESQASDDTNKQIRNSPIDPTVRGTKSEMRTTAPLTK